ncbi:hypothetical protein PILCRDRAFT_815682 [Piloderma croceum F 1598]|uniref:Gaa1-domain-containing protein n=1 Tax=Piloderma croceum (strain F 1598) TaxID=765440 RepID=A0A0C3G998_PILCF|nr:hypothetical protein PILCRDRAFT_815682 [Piloderma croceum F 1598]
MDKIRAFLKRPADANAIRIRRRKALTSSIYKRLPWLKIALFAIGYSWMLSTPLPQLANRTYIDENALQPGQVNTYWGWNDVHRADQYLHQLDLLRDTNATSEQRANFLMTEFKKLGISASTQNYKFTAQNGKTSGTNAYAIMSSPRTAGTEAIVISASWLSRIDDGSGTINIRGVSTVLALANFLRRYSLWAKDIIFVISDGYLDGMQAWLSAYHDTTQSNLDAEYLSLSSGVIWTALNIDYPGHSFSHLGVFFEGLNGRLPNQDLINSLQVIASRTVGVPVIVYDHLDPREFPSRTDLDIMPAWVPAIAHTNDAVKQYAYNAKNVLRHVGYEARGGGSGVHGLLHQFRIDAITLFAVPAAGPHGFHSLGRVIESTLRTANNLLERLHASFFFYIMTGPTTFLKIGSFLPSAVLVSVAMIFTGLYEWVNAAWILDEAHTEPIKGDLDTKNVIDKPTWIRRRRPVLQALGILIATHILGLLLFVVITTPMFAEYWTVLSPLLLFVVSAGPLGAVLATSPTTAPTTAPLSSLVKSLNLCLASTVISITSVLNFSLAATLAVLLGLPLTLASPSPMSSSGTLTRFIKYMTYIALGFGWIVWAPGETAKAVWNWEILGVWFAPFTCIVYAPLVLQAGLVCLFPS